jgi:hydrogenase assembly chaperone HypC/HupF
MTTNSKCTTGPIPEPVMPAMPAIIIPQAQVGDYVVIHVGFALTLLNEEEAQASLETLHELVDAKARLG